MRCLALLSRWRQPVDLPRLAFLLPLLHFLYFEPRLRLDASGLYLYRINGGALASETQLSSRHHLRFAAQTSHSCIRGWVDVCSNQVGSGKSFKTG